MKTSKFSEAQIAFVLKHADDGTAVVNVCVVLTKSFEYARHGSSRVLKKSQFVRFEIGIV